MTVEEQLKIFQKLSSIIKRRYDNSESLELLKALFDEGSDSDEDFAIGELQPMLELHLKTDPTDTETTSVLCELFAYCT